VPPPNRGGRLGKPRPGPGRAYVSVAEGAEYLNLSEKTLRRLIARGKLTGYRFGPRILRVKVADLDSIFTADSARRDDL
jgi:excisionase family DNA binding protein